MNYTKSLTSIGALVGVFYGIKKQKSFWGTASYVLIFSLAGATIGFGINQFKNEN
jgi:hypothetical protein